MCLVYDVCRLYFFPIGRPFRQSEQIKQIQGDERDRRKGHFGVIFICSLCQKRQMPNVSVENILIHTTQTVLFTTLQRCHLNGGIYCALSEQFVWPKECALAAQINCFGRKFAS